MRRRLHPAIAAGLLLGGSTAARTQEAPAPVERLTFEAAVQRAVEQHPLAGEAAQAILRAQALQDQAASVFLPTLYGDTTTTVLDAARGFDGRVTQPRTQTRFSATLSYPLLAASRWAEKTQAADQVEVSRISAQETRRNVALAAAQSYLAIIAAERQADIAERNRDTARALADYARARLEAGQGSRLNYLRAAQELQTSTGILEATQLALRASEEALGVAVNAPGPVGASGEPALPAALPPGDEAWLMQRPDVRLLTSEWRAAERVASDTWKSWLPTATASFTPGYVTPAGLFEPSKTWRAVFQFQVPIFDGTLGATKRLRLAEREIARLRLDQVEVQARSELRLAREAVERNERIVASTREAAETAGEVLRITEIAYRAGATTNIEVIQAQQAARNSESASAVAENRLRLARLDLLVALGQFP